MRGSCPVILAFLTVIMVFMCLAFVRFHTRGPRIVAASPTPPKPGATSTIAETSPPLTPGPKPGSTSEPGPPLTQYTGRAPPGASSAPETPPAPEETWEADFSFPPAPKETPETGFSFPPPEETPETDFSFPPAPEETPGTGFSFPPAPEETPETGFSFPPAPEETPETGFSFPPAPEETPGTGFSFPPAPGETLETSSSAPPGLGPTPGTSSRSHLPATSSSTLHNPFPSAASSSSGLNWFAARTRRPPGAVAQMMALPGGETQLGLQPPDQLPTVYDLVVVIDAGLKSKVTGQSEITFKVTEDNTTRIALNADEQVKVPQLVLVKGSDGKKMNTSSSRSRGFIIIETEEALREAESYVLKMEYEATVDDYPAATTGLMKSPQGFYMFRPEWGEASRAFPTFDGAATIAKVNLKVVAPATFTVLAGTEVDGTPTPAGTNLNTTFKTALDISMDNLVWAAFPNKIRKQPTMDAQKTALYSTATEAEAVAALANDFEAFTRFFGANVAKLDVVVTNDVELEGPGLVLLKDLPEDATAKKKKVRSVVGAQWVKHLVDGGQLLRAAVEYVGIIADAADDAAMHKSLQPYLEQACIVEPSAPPNAEYQEQRTLLLLRTLHLIMGDRALKDALKDFMANNKWESATDDELLNYLKKVDQDVDDAALLGLLNSTKVARVHVKRKYGTAPKLNVEVFEPGVAEGSVAVFNGQLPGIKCKEPEKISVSWVKWPHDVKTLSRVDIGPAVADSEAAIVNPALLTCANVTYDTYNWYLISERLAMNRQPPVDSITRWNMHRQAAAQTSNPMAALWVWKDMATEHDPDILKIFYENAERTEAEAAELVVNEGGYKAKWMTIIGNKLDKIEKKDIDKDAPAPRSEKLRLANVACLVGWQRCGDWVVDQLHIKMSDIEDRAYETNIRTRTALSPAAVACGFAAKKSAEVDAKWTSLSHTSPIPTGLLMVIQCIHPLQPNFITKIDEFVTSNRPWWDQNQVRTSEAYKKKLVEIIDSLSAPPAADPQKAYFENMVEVMFARDNIIREQADLDKIIAKLPGLSGDDKKKLEENKKKVEEAEVDKWAAGSEPTKPSAAG